MQPDDYRQSSGEITGLARSQYARASASIHATSKSCFLEDCCCCCRCCFCWRREREIDRKRKMTMYRQTAVVIWGYEDTCFERERKNEMEKHRAREREKSQRRRRAQHCAPYPNMQEQYSSRLTWILLCIKLSAILEISKLSNYSSTKKVIWGPSVLRTDSTRNSLFYRNIIITRRY